MLKHAVSATPAPYPVLEQDDTKHVLSVNIEKKTFTSKQGLTKHIGNNHKDLKKPEVQCSETSENSLNMSEVNEDRDNISLPLANSTINAE